MKGCAIKADTISNLAVKIGQDLNTMQDTVNRWNAACTAGAKPEYVRTTNPISLLENTDALS
jgi:hypothetical protein